MRALRLNKLSHYAFVMLFTIVVMIMFIPFANAVVGTGQLHVYIDTWGGTEAPKDGPKSDTHLIEIDNTYYIVVFGITEFNVGDLLTIKIGWTDTTDNAQTTTFLNIPVEECVGSGEKYVNVPPWSVPSNAKICTTCTVHYTNPDSPEYVASGQASTIGHTHIIPLTPLGTIGTILALFTGLTILSRRKHARN